MPNSPVIHRARTLLLLLASALAPAAATSAQDVRPLPAPRGGPVAPMPVATPVSEPATVPAPATMPAPAPPADEAQAATSGGSTCCCVAHDGDAPGVATVECACHGCLQSGAGSGGASGCSGCGAALAGTSPVPPGFVDELVLAGWNQAVGLTFAEDGRAFVWEKAGRVWIVDHGVKSAAPLIDISPEVANWGDHGLIGFALDPAFASNGYIYLLYVVDYHHLKKFGTPEYDPALNDYTKDTIGRITRYTATAASHMSAVDPASRLVLLGENIHCGFPISGSSHGVGSLMFGEDGTLFASCGDAAPGDGSNTMIADGIILPKENVGAFRAQLVDCLAGKLLRLDPATGDGVSSNPFFDPAAPRAPRSRVWALGLRNPSRLSLRPGTGCPDPLLGDPGTVTFGDVGAETYEELDVLPQGGKNLGWPIYEGHQIFPLAGPLLVQNSDAPNPLFQFGPHSPCPRPYFNFQDLLLQDSLNTPFWANPCNAHVPVVTPAPLFVHHRAALEWRHGGQAYAPTYDAAGLATKTLMGTPGCPVAGPSFPGNCSIGGAWSSDNGFPPEYQHGYFHGDYGVGWIRFGRFDGDDRLLSFEPFAEPIGRVVKLAWDESSGSLWYINYTNTGAGELRRIRWFTGNLPPQAVLTPALKYGEAPLDVAFDGSASSDPEGQPLDWLWDFGDGTPPSKLPRPVHRFPSEDITASGSIIGLVFELNPPGSTGFSNPDPEVIRDGDYPPQGTADKQREYDTIHAPGGVSDKNGVCWIGYSFPQARSFVGLFYEEGMTFGGGGWFDTWSVEVRQRGVWVAVEGVVVDPPYPPANGTPHFQRFEFRFPPVEGDALRIRGAPGGVGNLAFITIGELRVLAEPLVPGGSGGAGGAAANTHVTLTVTDSAGSSDQAGALVSLNNSPPTAVITDPPNFSTYAIGEPTTLTLQQASTDAEQGAALSCAWQVILHHNSHTHPGPLLEDCAPAPVDVTPEGCGSGAIYFNEVRLTVTDPLGLSSTRSHWLIPACDRNLNGIEDTLDLAAGTSLDLDQDSVPDEAQRDCNANGRPDLYELFFGYVRDLDLNGVPDDCDHGWTLGAMEKPPVLPPQSEAPQH